MSVPHIFRRIQDEARGFISDEYGYYSDIWKWDKETLIKNKGRFVLVMTHKRLYFSFEEWCTNGSWQEIMDSFTSRVSCREHGRDDPEAKCFIGSTESSIAKIKSDTARMMIESWKEGPYYRDLISGFKIIDHNPEYSNMILMQAAAMGDKWYRELLDKFEHLGYPNRYCEVDLYPDFAPLSFYFVVHCLKQSTMEMKKAYNGGIIFHGSHDGYGSGEFPTLAVTLDKCSGWQIHT
jgi:hypothetical protein